MSAPCVVRAPQDTLPITGKVRRQLMPSGLSWPLSLSFRRSDSSLTPLSVASRPAGDFHTPREAYFVKCDRETTTQNDINLGIVNIFVGFAPLKPAEFVVIKLQQIAGEIAT